MGGNRSIPQVTSINVYIFFIPIMCRYMHGHYHIHLRVRELAVTPSSVNHVALGDHLFLRLVLCEPHKAKSFGVSSLGIPFYLRQKKMHPAINNNCHPIQNKVMCVLSMLMLYLNHDDFSKSAKVIFEVLLRCFPGKTKYDQVRCLHVPSLHFYSRGCINFLHFPFVV